MSIFEYHLHERGYRKIAGVDEAGRGPLAGPVVAACCLLPYGFELIGIDDSKKVDAALRKEIYQSLINDPKVEYSVAIVDVEKIDRLNILHATLYGMKKAILEMKNQPDYLLVDGNQLPDVDIAKEAIVSGDAYSLSIAAASIIAKCTRDELMEKYHEQFSNYKFDQNKGYGTAEHLRALEKYGPCPIHRKSFEPVKKLFNKREEQLGLSFE